MFSPTAPAIVPRLLRHVLLFLVIAATSRSEPVKLALWAERGLENISFVLGAKLSRSTDGQIALLERDQIGKIIEEAKLGASGLGVEQAGSACRLLGADALLWLEHLKIGERKLLLTRLVTARTGIVVGWRLDEKPPDDPDAWSNIVQAGLTKWLEKLSVPPERTITVSLLNLREAGRSSATPTGPVLNRLLAGELSSRSDVFVLERWRMEDLALENELLGETARSFWNGAWLLDGSFTQVDGVIDLELRLRAADGRESRWQERGAPDAALVSRIAARMMERMGQVATAARWNPEAEAREFLSEARWAERWELGRPAIEAIEAAMALGLDSPEAHRIRYRAYGRLATEAPPHQILELGFFTVGYLETNLVRLSPGADRLANARHACALFRDVRHGPVGAALTARPSLVTSPSYARTNPRTVSWHERDAEELLLRAMRLLATAYYAPLTEEERVLARELRADARALFENEWASLAPELTLRDPERLPLAPRGGRGTLFDSLPVIGLVGGVFWAERPSDHVEIVRSLLAADLRGHPLLYDELLVMLPVVQWPGWDVDWTTHDPAKSRAVWEKFAQENAVSPNLGLRLAGVLWPLGRKWPLAYGAQALKYQTEAWRFLIGHVEAFGGGRLPAQYAIDIAQAAPGFALSEQLREDLIAELIRNHSGPVSDAENLNAFVAALPLRADELERLRIARAQSPDTAPPSVATSKKASERSPAVRQAALPMRVAWSYPAPPLASYRNEAPYKKVLWASMDSDRLWLVVSAPGEHLTDDVGVALLRLDLPELTMRKTLSWQVRWREMANLYDTFPAYALVDGALYGWTANHVVKRPLDGRPAEPLALPIDQQPRLWSVSGKLYAGLSHGGVLRVKPKTGAWDLLADSRRRPGDGLLSDCPPYEIDNIWCDDDGVVRVAQSIGDDLFGYDEVGKKWTTRPAWSLPFPPARFDRRQALQSFRHMEQAHFGYRAPELEQLVSDVRREGLCDRNFSPGEYFGGETTPLVDGSLRTTWSFLAGVVEGETLWALFNHYWDKNRAPHLVWLPPASHEPLVIRLDLPADDMARITPPDTDNHEGGFFGEGPRILASPHGLFIYAPQSPVVWHIPQAALAELGAVRPL